MEWKEFKEIIPERTIVKIEPTEISIGVVQMYNGSVKGYKFMVEKVSRDKDMLWNHSVYAHGVITYDDGKSYPSTLALTYTDSEDLAKLAEKMRKAEPTQMS